MEQTLDEIDASVATPHKRSIQVVRCSRKTVAYTVLSQWASFDVGTCLVQAPVPTALLVCNADVSLSNFKPNTHRRRDATVELSRVGSPRELVAKLLCSHRDATQLGSCVASAWALRIIAYRS